jgi:predicted Zn-dependent peptidase
MVLAWDVPANDPLSGMLLSDLIAKRLFGLTLLRTDVVSSDCDHDTGALASPLICYLELTDDAAVDDMSKWLGFVVDGLWTGKGAKQLKKRFKPLKSQVEIGIRFGMDRHRAGTGGRATIMARSLYFRDHAAPWQAALDKLETLSAKDVIELAQTWLAPNTATLLIVRAGDKPQREPVPALAPVEARPLPEASSRDPRPLATAEQTLDNGMRVLAIQRTDVQIATAMLRIRREQSPASLFSELADLVVTPEISSGEREGVIIDEATTPTSVIYSAHGPASETSHVLDALLDTVENWLVLFPMTPVATALSAARAEMEREEPEFWTDVLVNAALFPDEESVKTALRTRLAEIEDHSVQEQARALMVEATSRFQPGNAELVLVGPDTPQAQLKTADAVFSSWQGSGWENDLELPERAIPDPALWLVDDPEAKAIGIHFACPIQGEGAAATAVLEAALNLGLVDRLRHRTGLTYTPGA